MSNSIQGMFVHEGKLFVRTTSGIVSVRGNGEHPRNWPQEQFAGSLDGLDAFQAFFFDEALEMLKGTIIFGQDRQEVVDAIMIMVLEGLLPAFDELRSIRLTKDKPTPILNRRKQYETLAHYLWRAYKDSWPRVAGLLGYDIGFMFEDRKFNVGLNKFVEQHQPHLLLDVREFVERQRANWQQDLATFRNDFINHRKKKVAATVDRFYEPDWAEMIFVSVWRTIAELLSTFLESRFHGHLSIDRATDPTAVARHRMWQLKFCNPVARAPLVKVVSD